MKLLICLLLIFTSNAFGMDFCAFRNTEELRASFEEKKIKPKKVSKDHKTFTNIEKKLIHHSLLLHDWRRSPSLKESIEEFADLKNDEPGPHAGEIVYYKIGRKTFMVVHYWPKGEEYGAIYESKDRTNNLNATISDGEIECQLFQ
jgi:hypothetical protein